MTTKTATKKRLNNHKHIETPLSWPVLPLLTSGSLGGRRRFALRTSGLAAGSGLGIEGARKGQATGKTGDREDMPFLPFFQTQKAETEERFCLHGYLDTTAAKRWVKKAC